MVGSMIMTTNHQIHVADSRALSMTSSESVDLVVTSPPYPMIEMWDKAFGGLNPVIANTIAEGDGRTAFTLMHRELDLVWREISRVLKVGGWACINIGDATRKIGDYFQLYSNHSRINEAFFALGMDSLPVIIWRKQTNAPNKFMGSGMLPGGAYVTLEHEYILIFRKGHKREFWSGEQVQNRRISSYFWEERNLWFSDTWDFKGVRQAMGSRSPRERSAAYPFELAYRLINMYSVYGDTVLDPFLGTGTTTFAALAAGRHSIGVEISDEFLPLLAAEIVNAQEVANDRIDKRLMEHREFIDQYRTNKKEPKHYNSYHEFPVITTQERDLELRYVSDVTHVTDTSFTATYSSQRPISLPLFQI